MADTNWLSSLNATVLQNYIPILQDNVFESNPVLQKLQANKGLLSSVKPEGQNLLVPIITGKNDTAVAYSGYDKLPVGPQKGFQDAEIGYASYNVSVTISKQEETRAAGNKTKMVSLLNGRMMQAENSLYELLTNDIFVSTGVGAYDKHLTGLDAMIPATSAITTAYMGLTSVPAWAHKYKAAGLATLIADMETLFRQVKDGMDKTDLIITSDLGEQVYGTKLGTGGYTVAYASNTNMDFGPVSYTFKGIPIVTDKSCPDATDAYPIYYFLNTKYLGFMFANWDVGAYLKPIDQHAKTSLISVDTQLITNNRRRQGKLVVTGA